MAMKQTGLQCLVLCICILRGFCFSDDDDFEIASDSVLTVEHSFDTGPKPVYTKRGTVVVQSIKSGSAEFQQERPLEESEADQLKNLAAADGIYRIRISSKGTDGVTRHVSSFTKACGLYESRLVDNLTVHMDQSGNVIGVSITTSTAYCLGLSIPNDDLSDFHTTVDVIQTVPGPAPETQSFVEKMDRDRVDKAKGQQPDNRSFFAKYWMYIVPVVIVMMFANSADPSAQGGGAR